MGSLRWPGPGKWRHRVTTLACLVSDGSPDPHRRDVIRRAWLPLLEAEQVTPWYRDRVAADRARMEQFSAAVETRSAPLPGGPAARVRAALPVAYGYGTRC